MIIQKEQIINPSHVSCKKVFTKSKTINLHFTDLCNYCCHHCFIKKSGNELSLKQIKLIIDKIYDYALKNKIKVRINLAGGEPLISKNIQKIIDYIYSKDMDVSIITNGMLLTKEFIENNKNKLSMIGISVDSLKETTNRIIGRCFNEKTLTKEELINVCKHIKNNGINLKINICISKHNINEDFKEFLREVKSDRIKFLRVLIDHDKSLNNISISDDEWKRLQNTYCDINNSIFEDNEFMRNQYLIIDSLGNLSKNNEHLINNSLIDKSFEECLEALHMEVL